MKVVYTSREKEFLSRLDNIEVTVEEGLLGLIPLYMVYLRDKDGWIIDGGLFMTKWGVSRYIRKITKKKEDFDRSQHGG